MTKEEILAAAGFPNTPEGISAFYEAYPKPGDWQQAQQMGFGGVPLGLDIMLKHGGMPCYECGGPHMQVGGAMTQDLEGRYPMFNYGGMDGYHMMPNGEYMSDADMNYDLGGDTLNYFQKLVKASMKKTGGNTTLQGGNQQNYPQEQMDYTTNFLANTAHNAIAQETGKEVQNAFMQAEKQYAMNQDDGYMAYGGNSYDQMNPQNAALQNMYANQINTYQNQRAQDHRNLFNAFSENNLPEAEDGVTTGQPDHSAILRQLAEEFGPASRRTGLPLFPANIDSYYGINKRDSKKLAGIPQGFQMDGVEITPKWGFGARTAMNVGNLFRNKENDKTVPGWAPKKIHYKFSGKRGYRPEEPRPDGKTVLPQVGPQTAQNAANPYGPAPTGTTQAGFPFMPASVMPGYNASGKSTIPQMPGQYNWNAQLPQGKASDMLNQSASYMNKNEDNSVPPEVSLSWGETPNYPDYQPQNNYNFGPQGINSVDPDWNAISRTSPGWQQDAMVDQYMKNTQQMNSVRVNPYAGDPSAQTYVNEFYGLPKNYRGQIPQSKKVDYARQQLQSRAYGGALKKYQKWGEVQNQGQATPVSFSNNYPNTYSFSGAPATSSYVNPYAKPQIKTADESKNTPYQEGSKVQYDRTRDRSNEDISVEGDLSRKYRGVGAAVGQYMDPIVNTVAGALEAPAMARAKQNYEYTKIADNAMVITPMNAKNRGDYDPNSGMFQPNNYVYGARYGGFMQEGGMYNEGEELDLSEQEIADLEAQGYTIERQ